MEIISIDDATARVNALAAGQVDAIAEVDATLAPTISTNPNLTLLERASGSFTSQYMDLQKPPFNDPKVAQAFRLLTNRTQMITNGLDGAGKIGNDLEAWYDPDYASSIQQRVADPEQAKFLLQQAGMSGLTVTLNTSDAAPAMLQSSELFAQQALSAGVKINLKNWPVDNYYSTNGAWLNTAFACTNYVGNILLYYYVNSLLPGCAWPETGWNNASFNQLATQAFATTDAAMRKELLAQTEQLLWNEGGYIIWGFTNNIDAVSSKVKGMHPSVLRHLNENQFGTIYFAK